MNKVTVLTEIHSLLCYILELPDSVFSKPKKRKEIIGDLLHYYHAVAKDGSAGEIEAAYEACTQSISANIADEEIRVRAEGTIDDINGDVQPTT